MKFTTEGIWTKMEKIEMNRNSLTMHASLIVCSSICSVICDFRFEFCLFNYIKLNQSKMKPINQYLSYSSLYPKLLTNLKKTILFETEIYNGEIA